MDAYQNVSVHNWIAQMISQSTFVVCQPVKRSLLMYSIIDVFGPPRLYVVLGPPISDNVIGAFDWDLWTKLTSFSDL